MGTFNSEASAGNGAGKGSVTRVELEHLEARKPKPFTSMEYTPSGPAVEAIHRMEELRRAVRTSFIRNRLDRAEGRAANDFGLARVHGKAEHDFERSR